MPATPRKVLVLTFPLLPTGGGSALGAWALEALKGPAYEVDVLSWRGSDLEEVNRIYGTSLRVDDFRWLTPPASLRRAVNAVPLRLSLLEMMLVNRMAQRLVARGRYDAILGTVNEIDVGRRACQYVHFPWLYFPRPGRDPSDHRWFHLAPLVRLYRGAAMRVAPFVPARSRANRTFVNSRWTAERYRECHGVIPDVLYPPVTNDFPRVPDAERRADFACVGRIAEDKEIPKLIDIVAGVRAAGFDVGLRVIGASASPSLVAALRARAAQNRWLSVHADLPRAALTRTVAECRYGLHGKQYEHFGIAPAELQFAGCLSFVPDDGGSVEVVGADTRLVYASVDDAVRKIVAVLGNPALEASLRARLPALNQQFSTDEFMRRIRAVVDTAETGP